METSESLEEGLIPDPPFLVPRPLLGGHMRFFSHGYAVFRNHYCSNGSLIDYFFQIGYSSPAESGITADLGLSVREACDSICIIVTRQIPIYITEIAPKNVRGAYTATNQLLVASGLSVTYLVGTVVSCLVLALIAAVPCLLQVVGLFFIPETYLKLMQLTFQATIGKEKELDTTLQRLMGKTADISMESPDIRDYTKTFKNDSRAGIFYLFQRNYAYSLSVGVGLMVMQPLVGSAAIAYYASYIFAAADLLTDIRSISTAIIQLPAIVASVLLTDKSGRRPLLLASAIGSCLSLSIIALAFCLQDTNHWNEVTPVLAYIGIMGFSVLYSVGMGGLPSVIMSEIFSINIKGSAGSLVIQLHNCSSWIVTYTFLSMMEWSTIVCAGYSGRNIFYILGHLCCSCPIRCISGAGDQGTNT
ncbi:Sugar transporter ERD6-like 5 [Citrus sinensis]|uniref:Sugar transporter ERD6-like 5 n=1 Tax=Citrus sinensis TaxID=2711 RepID=A0ACB8KK38_CITSI|nr:Sugar transporter ERD6-like 5 [Citrus sinensis]